MTIDLYDPKHSTKIQAMKIIECMISQNAMLNKELLVSPRTATAVTFLSSKNLLKGDNWRRYRAGRK